ncbi:hypothetical protein BH10PSE14_BH10PSE14_28960 [soil metagenome]
MAMRPETKAERRLRAVTVHNASQRLAEIVCRLNEIDDAKSAKYKRVHREMMKAAEQVAAAFASPISDGALRYFNGEEAVQERADAAQKRRLGKIVPFVPRSR